MNGYSRPDGRIIKRYNTWPLALGEYTVSLKRQGTHTGRSTCTHIYTHTHTCKSAYPQVLSGWTPRPRAVWGSFREKVSLDPGPEQTCGEKSASFKVRVIVGGHSLRGRCMRSVCEQIRDQLISGVSVEEGSGL